MQSHHAGVLDQRRPRLRVFARRGAAAIATAAATASSPSPSSPATATVFVVSTSSPLRFAVAASAVGCRRGSAGPQRDRIALTSRSLPDARTPFLLFLFLRGLSIFAPSLSTASSSFQLPSSAAAAVAAAASSSPSIRQSRDSAPSRARLHAGRLDPQSFSSTATTATTPATTRLRLFFLLLGSTTTTTIRFVVVQ